MKGFYSLLRELKNYKKYTIISVLFQLITALFTLVSIPLVIPFFQIIFGASPSDYQSPKSILDLEGTLNYGFSRLIAISDRSHALAFVCIAVVIVFLFRNLSRYAASYFMVPARNGLLKDLRTQLFDAFLKMPLSLRTKSKKGQLLSLLSNDINEIDHGVLTAIELLFKVPLIVMGSLIFMIWINVKLSIVAIFLVLITIFVIGQLSHMLKKTSLKVQEQLGEIISLSSDYFGAGKIIQSYNAQDFFQKRFATQNNRHYQLSNRILRRRELASPLAEFLAIGIISYLLFYGSNMVFKQEILPATFFAFIFAFYNIIDPAKSFSREYYNIQKGISGLKRISSFLSEVEAQSINIKGKRSITGFDKEIKFDDVSFSYEGSESFMTLKNISFTINRGDKIGVVGHSGVGKSTLFDLLLNFYSPIAGQILIDGISIDEYSIDQYRRLYGLVTQDPQLFHMSLEENIAFSDTLLPEYLYDKASIAYLKDRSYLNKNIVGDDGIKLSGGERQRICIARAIYHDPDIVLLDEPTSSLDAQSEKDVIASIHELLEDRTIIMITHNIQLLKSMNRIIVMDKGEIVEEGTYEQLLELNGTFANLSRMKN